MLICYIATDLLLIYKPLTPLIITEKKLLSMHNIKFKVGIKTET